MRPFALSVLAALSLSPALALAAPHAVPKTVGDVAGKKNASWLAEASAPAGPADGVGPTQPRRGTRADVTPGARSEVWADSEPEVQADEAKRAASEARTEVLRAKLAVADALAARASCADVQRIALADFQLLLQRATCAAVHGSLERGEGAECFARPAVPAYDEHADDEETQLCAEQGGVLVRRMEGCTQASVALASMHVDEEASVGLEALVGAFAEVARKCWGRTLCVE